MNRISAFAAVLGLLVAPVATAAINFTPFEGIGADTAALTAIRDAFRAAIGGGTTAGANGSFGGLRREINWDGVPAGFSDPNALLPNFFNVNSPRGVVFSTPGTGFLVSANSGGATPILFGFPNDFQTFSPQKLFTAVNSNITDVTFFVPGTNTAATVSAFALIFVDVEVAGLSRIEFFNALNQLIYTRDALVGGNQGLSFVGGVANAGERIARVRITSGSNTIVANGQLGNPIDDIVVMDDFLFSTPVAADAGVPEPTTVGMLGFGMVALGFARKALARKAARS